MVVLPSVLAHAGQPVAHHDRRAGCFVAGLLVVWLALESPVDALGWVGVAGVHGHRTQFEAIALLGVIALQGIWGGALFVFASRPIYEPYLDTTQPWGLDPVDDISLGGVIMCVAGLAFVVTAVVRLVSLLLSLEGGDRRRPTPTPLPT
ncbi:MAG: cytochrome c oxidase assembly protein [Acidimicrobiales bacterium]|jgi:putative membrane protein|nr:cytochrome c oxidase assembly protein [Acidimicrobiales bacterium]